MSLNLRCGILSLYSYPTCSFSTGFTMYFLKLRLSCITVYLPIVSCCLGLMEMNVSESNASSTIGYLNSSSNPYCSMFSGFALMVITAVVSSCLMSFFELLPNVFLFGFKSLNSSTAGLSMPSVSVLRYFTLR